MRLTSALLSSAASLALALGSGALFPGCKSSEAVRTERAGDTALLRAPIGDAEPPAESPLARVKNEMSPDQVHEIMGSPTGRSSYPTAKTYNPYGNDSGNRVVYMYEGHGRVLFAVPKNGGDMRVLRVDVDPTEDGR